LFCFNPALFTSGSLSSCVLYKERKRANKSRIRTRPIPIIRPKIWLYYDFDYSDTKAINQVKVIDFKAKPNTVIIVGTTLKVQLTKIFARDIYYAACEDGGFAA
jgi:hypothetical protein